MTTLDEALATQNVTAEMRAESADSCDVPRFPRLVAKNLGKSFVRAGVKQETFWPLRGVSLELFSGELATLRGRSGAGKSTLIHCLLGLLAPDEGEITVAGTSLTGLSDEAVSQLRNEKVGYVPQSAALIPTLSVLDNVRLPWYLSKRDTEPVGRALALLERVGLADYAAVMPSRLSGGETRRVALVRALMCEPAIIIADEPTASLDEESARSVVKLLREAADRGAAVLSVTHDPVGLEMSDRIFELSDGRLSPLEGFPRTVAGVEAGLE